MEQPQEIRYQEKIAGETAAIRRIRGNDSEEFKRLAEIDKDPNRIQWFESRPDDYVVMNSTELRAFAQESNKHLLFIVSGSEQVSSEEKYKLQGWIKVNPDAEDRIRQIKERKPIELPEATKLEMVEISYARHPDASPHQMASAVRQVCVKLASMMSNADKLSSTSYAELYKNIIVTAYVLDKEPPNTASINVLRSAGFEEKGKIRYDAYMEKDDRLFVLNWDTLFQKISQKVDPQLYKLLGINQ